MPSEEVIELSVEETNKLRAELGLAPLRIDGAPKREEDESPHPPTPASKPNQDDAAEVLELSVDETNKLREQLGLPPLRTGGSGKNIQDAKLKEKQRAEEEAQAAERAQLEADVKMGISKTFTEKSLGEDASNDLMSWAEKLRQAKSPTETKKKKKKKDKQPNANSKYDEEDLKGIAVSHAVSELEAGSTTVMTLTDAPILQTKENNPYLVTGLNDDADNPQLENVNLAESSKQADGLRKKRQLEMGMGRAGGYAGFDDDEFLELGGTGVPSRAARGAPTDPNHKKPRKGFQIGDGTNNSSVANGGAESSDLFAMEMGNAISLEPMQADVQASDFMTEQEDLELNGKKKRKKDKFEKKKKKKDKKERKKHRRKAEEDDESEDDGLQQQTKSGKSLLDELEETAEDSTADKKSRKRSRSEEDNDDSDKIKKEDEMEEAPTSIPVASNLVKPGPKGVKKEDKRAKYDAIMDKGNARTKEAFGSTPKKSEADVLDDEPDDAFLNAALAKARRLKKLRGMNAAKGAEAVVEAVQSMPDTANSTADATSNGGVVFSIDETREFTRALKARSEQQSRQQTKAAVRKENPPTNTLSTVAPVKKEEVESNLMEVETVKEEEGTEDVDMAELAKEIKDDDNNTPFLEGGTGSTVAVGRGMAGMLNLLKQTGELTRKNAGKEEMRGRAKDARTYEDYEALDLKKVVKIDHRYATDKDREIASREVKLEYRDKHGRLLTRKEAFRDLCYQFHGHGSSKRKEEKKQKQMAREQAEARFASQQLLGSDGGPGTLGALKATQKATGKAFVVHKT